MMAQEKQCRTCKYWEAVKGPAGRTLESPRASGVCKRFPPIADFTWPKTRGNEWCWEYKQVDTND